MNGYMTMRSHLPLSVAAAILTLTLVGTVGAEEGKLSLTLKDAIRQAAERNLDVQAELFNPALAEADIRRSRGIYDPTLKADTGYKESASTNPTQFSANISKTKQMTLNGELSQLTPWGGTFDIKLENSWNKNNFSNTMDRYYANALTATFFQPLLKNFGRENTELNITLATYNKEASLDQFRIRLIAVITQVRTEYFKLYYLREDLEVKKSSQALAQKILDETRARVKAGVLPAMEILNAEFNVSTREKQVIDAERALSDERDLLRTLLQMNDPGEIDPVDSPFSASNQVSETESLKLALTSRPELKQLHESLKSAELQEKVFRNQVMPDLTVNATGGLAGVDRDYLGQWKVLARGDYPVWGIGVSISYPLGNSTAENDFIKSKLKSEQIRAQIRSQEEAIANEVRSAIRGVQSGYKQLDVTRRGSVYAEEVLNAYIKKAAVGLATTKDVFDVQNNLVAAKGSEIQARVGYDNALTQFWKSTGEILQREGVKINGKEADGLYGRMQ